MQAEPLCQTTRQRASITEDLIFALEPDPQFMMEQLLRDIWQRGSASAVSSTYLYMKSISVITLHGSSIVCKVQEQRTRLAALDVCLGAAQGLIWQRLPALYAHLYVNSENLFLLAKMSLQAHALCVKAATC